MVSSGFKELTPYLMREILYHMHVGGDSVTDLKNENSKM